MKARLEITDIDAGEGKSITVAMDFPELRNFLELHVKIKELMEAFETMLETAVKVEEGHSEETNRGTRDEIS